jgi:hypothetical protein
LVCSGFKRWNGVLLLVVELPDGSPGTVRADATNVFGQSRVFRTFDFVVFQAAFWLVR